MPTLLGEDTAGTYLGTLLFDGSLYGLTGNEVTGMDVSQTGGVLSIATPADFDTLDAADGTIDGIAKVQIDFNAVQAAHGIPLEGTHLLSVESIDMAGNISHQSEQLVVEIDVTAPEATVPALAGSSDSGQAGDNKTNKMQPAFVGTAEANAKVRVYANGILVGQGVATSQGDWEITVEPLADGMYTITTEVEDLAGNITAGPGTGEDIVVMIDTTAPQRPTLDLENSDDTGMSNLDNVTFGDPALTPGVMDFFVTADAGTTILIKDGNTVINDQIVLDAAAPDRIIYLSLNSGATLPGIAGDITVDNEDIVAFDGTYFSIFFDGSLVLDQAGSPKLDALAVISDNEILLSFTTPQTIPGIVDEVQISDIVKFTATQLGDNTAGTFELFFDGSAAGLEGLGADVAITLDTEDIDAVDLHSDGRLIVSTVGPFEVPGVTGEDDDLIAFTPDTPGDYSAGTWAIYFDGSDVELDPEDINAVALNAAGDIDLSVTSAFAVTGISGDDEDVFTFLPTQLGDDTTGTYSSTLLFDGSLYGLDTNDITGLDLDESVVAPTIDPTDFDALDAADGTIDGIAKVRIDFNAVQAAHGIPLEGIALAERRIDRHGGQHQPPVGRIGARDRRHRAA